MQEILLDSMVTRDCMLSLKLVRDTKEKNMFKIGEFSQISQVTVQTLRHYDEIGLLKPTYVDHITGYRYYSLDMLPRLNRILALKDVGLSLNEIGVMLQDDVSLEELQAILSMKLAELEAQRQQTEVRIMRVQLRLHQIEREHEMQTEEVVLKSVDAIQVLSIRHHVSTWAEIPGFFGEVTAAVLENELTSSGPWIAIYHDSEWVANNIDMEIALPMKKQGNGKLPIVANQPMKISCLTQVKNIASLLHQGPYETKGDTLVSLARWIEMNHYQFAGTVREVYLRGPLDTDDPASYVTEMQVPVQVKPRA